MCMCECECVCMCECLLCVCLFARVCTYMFYINEDGLYIAQLHTYVATYVGTDIVVVHIVGLHFL